MSGWDDLFALAGGVEQEETTTTESNNQVISPITLTGCNTGGKKYSNKSSHEREQNNENDKKQEQRIKRRRQHQNNASVVDEDLSMEKMLESRFWESSTDRIAPWPQWLVLREPLINKKAESKNRKTNHTIQNQYDVTESSPDSLIEPLQRSLYFSVENTTHHPRKGDDLHHFFLEMFAEVRNIRCCCACYTGLFNGSAPSSSKPRSNDHYEAYSRSAVDRSRRLMSKTHSQLSASSRSCVSIIPPGELEILHEKCVGLLKSCDIWLAKITVTKTAAGPAEPNLGNRACFDEVLKVIIDSDAVYYRLYYLQIAGMLPLVTLDRHGSACAESSKKKFKTCRVKTSSIFIPHPTTYFGIDSMCWDVASGLKCTNTFLNEIKQEFRASGHQEEELDSLIDQFGLAPLVCNTLSHPLYFLRRIKMMETILLFWNSGWSKSNDTLALIKSALRGKSTIPTSINSGNEINFYEQHETLAPTILSDWRNSCRDMLCNLYGYATLSPTCIHELNKTLKRYNFLSQGLVELGAGTGYLARLLKESGCYDVTAFDIFPTMRGRRISLLYSTGCEQNEYHGLTPYFSPVAKGGINSLKEYQKGLLLCYPPPESTMALASLKLYTSLGGKCFIHVGEFQGLTGSDEFETFLLRTNFQCVMRKYCVSWGTDAAEITVWIKREVIDKHKDKKHEVLVPCCGCFKNESTKRCRLLRTLNYCSQKCFVSHERERIVHLALNMIDSKIWKKNILDFFDPRHFFSLTIAH